VAEQVDRYGESGFMGGGILPYHHFQPQGTAVFFGKRNTDEAAPFPRHKIHKLGSHVAGSGNEVAFIFAVFIVDHNHQATLAYFFDGFFDGMESGITHADITMRGRKVRVF
jgi:hypothetical protein